MVRTIFFMSLTAITAATISACSSGDIAVGSSEQALKKTPKGNPTGNGTTCSWDDAVSYDVATGKETVTPSPNGQYRVGDSFKSSDGCNDCSCTAQGITCTLLACDPGGGSCSYGGKTYAVGQTTPSLDGCNTCSCVANGGGAPSLACTERYCAPQACTDDAWQCWDGSYVSRTGPKCEFAPCPEPVACATDAKQCPDGSYVGRSGPKCEFAPCP